ncbi:MAG: hypothetical protein DELT_01727 [Desulfovibrio sp.]
MGISLQSDFTAGELSPSLLARVDLAKYSKGARTMRNFFVQSHGPAMKRPGFMWLGELPGPGMLVEFAFNSEQSYALVFGEKWLRVATHDGFIHTDEGVPYEIETPYTLEQARELSYVQSADVLFLACRGVAPHRLMRLAHDEWRFEAMNFDAPLAAPEWASGGYVYAYTYGAYKISPYPSLDNPGTGETENGTAVSVEVYENAGGTYRAYASGTHYYYARGQSTWNAGGETNLYPVDLYTRVYRHAASFVNGAKDSEGKTSAAQLVTPYTYYVTAVNADGKESGISEGADITGPASNNWQAGDYIQLTWLPVEGAEEYRVYKSEFGGRAGYVATIGSMSGGTTYQDYNVTPSVSEGAPVYADPFILEDANGNQVEDFPGAVCLFEQRLVFASSQNRPQTIWMSKSGDYDNFATYSPITDDSPIELTIASQEVSAANWMVPLRSLIFGTPSMEWEIAGAGGGAFAAKSARATPQSYWGSSLRRAMVVGNVILHVSSSGSQVRNLQYDFTSDSYGGADLTIMAAHILEKETVIDWAFQKNPDSVIWAVRSDGVLLGLTFQAEHQIAAWHRHDTQGKFTAVCSVPHGFEYSLFAIVERGVERKSGESGAGGSRWHLERMAERYAGGDVAHAVFLDAARTFSGDTPVRTVSGLDHLEGKEVGVFTNGAVEAPRTVRDGTITLDAPSDLVTVGLLYTADLETMPVELMGQQGASVGLKKQISSVNVAFHESLGVTVGVCVDLANLDTVNWQSAHWRGNESYGTPPAPFTGIKHITVPALAENSASVCIRSESPTPVTVQSIMTRIEVKG